MKMHHNAPQRISNHPSHLERYRDTPTNTITTSSSPRKQPHPHRHHQQQQHHHHQQQQQHQHLLYHSETSSSSSSSRPHHFTNGVSMDQLDNRSSARASQDDFYSTPYSLSASSSGNFRRQQQQQPQQTQQPQPQKQSHHHHHKHQPQHHHLSSEFQCHRVDITPSSYLIDSHSHSHSHSHHHQQSGRGLVELDVEPTVNNNNNNNNSYHCQRLNPAGSVVRPTSLNQHQINDISRIPDCSRFNNVCKSNAVDTMSACSSHYSTPSSSSSYSGGRSSENIPHHHQQKSLTGEGVASFLNTRHSISHAIPHVDRLLAASPTRDDNRAAILDDDVIYVVDSNARYEQQRLSTGGSYDDDWNETLRRESTDRSVDESCLRRSSCKGELPLLPVADVLDVSSTSGGCDDDDDVEPHDIHNPASVINRTLPPCRICGATASGFHYGVNSCEACKGFFRRAMKRPMMFHCSKNRTCNIKGNRRSTCRFCRYKRCLSLGMSKEAIKTGRYSHKKRTSDIIEVKQLEKLQGSPPAEETDFEDMINLMLVAHETQQSLSSSKESAAYIAALQKEYLNLHSSKNKKEADKPTTLDVFDKGQADIAPTATPSGDSNIAPNATPSGDSNIAPNATPSGDSNIAPAPSIDTVPDGSTDSRLADDNWSSAVAAPVKGVLPGLGMSSPSSESIDSGFNEDGLLCSSAGGGDEAYEENKMISSTSSTNINSDDTVLDLSSKNRKRDSDGKPVVNLSSPSQTDEASYIATSTYALVAMSNASSSFISFSSKEEICDDPDSCVIDLSTNNALRSENGVQCQSTNNDDNINASLSCDNRSNPTSIADNVLSDTELVHDDDLGPEAAKRLKLEQSSASSNADKMNNDVADNDVDDQRSSTTTTTTETISASSSGCINKDSNDSLPTSAHTGYDSETDVSDIDAADKKEDGDEEENNDSSDWSSETDDATLTKKFCSTMGEDHCIKIEFNETIKSRCTDTAEGVQRAEGWVSGYINFAKSIPGFSEMSSHTKVLLLGLAWDEVWMLQAYSGYNKELGVATLPSGRCFDLQEMQQGWGNNYTQVTFDVANILKGCTFSQEMLVLLKAICIVSPDRCPASCQDKAEKIHWLLINCLLKLLQSMTSEGVATFPRLVSILTSLRDLSESAQRNRPLGQIDQTFAGALFPDCLKCQ